MADHAPSGMSERELFELGIKDGVQMAIDSGGRSPVFDMIAQRIDYSRLGDWGKEVWRKGELAARDATPNDLGRADVAQVLEHAMLRAPRDPMDKILFELGARGWINSSLASAGGG